MTTEPTGAAEAVVNEPSLESIIEAAAGGDPVNPVEVVDGGEGDPDPAAEVVDPAPKPKKTAQERIGELTFKAREAERRAEAAERQLAEANASRPAGDEEPDPADYEYGEADIKFIRAITRYEMRQEIAQHAQQTNAQAEQAKAADIWNRATAEASAKYEDFDEVVNDPDLAITPAMALTIREAGKDGAEIAYHLGKNPAEARRIAALTPSAQARELGKIEASLAKPAPKTVTDAPVPAPQVRAPGGQFKVAADTSDFAAFERQHFGKT